MIGQFSLFPFRWEKQPETHCNKQSVANLVDSICACMGSVWQTEVYLENSKERREGGKVYRDIKKHDNVIKATNA